MLTRRKILVSASALALSGGLARAQAWPNRFVRLIVPYPAGGGADAIARIVGQRLSEMWGQQVLIENKGGAGGNIASDAAAKSPPDGYTMYLGAEFLTTNPHVYPKLSYDPVADLDAGHRRGAVPDRRSRCRTPRRRRPCRSSSHYAKSKPGRTFGDAGPRHRAASRGRTVQARRRHRAHPRALSRRRARRCNDLIPGRIDSFFNNIAPVVPLMHQGQVRGLAVTTARRSGAAPDVPTIAESGLPGFDVPGWYAIFVPAKSPPEIVAKMNTDINAALADPTVKARLEDLGLFVGGSTPEALGTYVKAETEKWGPVIKAAGISIKE